MIVALSSGTSPYQSALDIQEAFSSSDADSNIPTIDKLLGMTTQLWPVMYSLARLDKMRKEANAVEVAGFYAAACALRAEMKIKGESVEQALKDWRPLKRNGTTISSLQFCTENGAEVENHRQSIVCNAEAYRQAALVHLYRRVNSQARCSSTVQYHTKATLAACLRVIMYEGPMSTLLWPLFIGACEARKDMDRQIAKMIFQELMGRQGFLNIKQAWEIVKEVWRRSEAKAEEVRWEDVCHDRDMTIVFA